MSGKMILPFLALAALSSFFCVNAALSIGYYNQSCPSAEYIVFQTLANETWYNSRLPATMTRMHFHDCFVEGCDSSICLDSTPGNMAEKDFAANNPSLLGGFPVIDKAKTALEQQCPGVVSCADIITFLARDALHLSGLPYYAVPGGRRDGRVSNASRAAQFLPPPSFNITQLKTAFATKSLTADDMATLSGAHTIGVSHCSSFNNRLYNFTGQGNQDPSLNSTYAATLKMQCPANSSTDPTVPMDSTPTNFDVNYYSGIRQSKGLFTSDAELLKDSVTNNDVIQYSQNQTLFFEKFVAAMLKMGQIEVKTGSVGEIRLNCHVVN